MAQEPAGAPPCPACGGTVYGYGVKLERDGAVTVIADCAGGSCGSGYYERFTFPAPGGDGSATTEDIIAAHRAYRQTERMHAAALAQVTCVPETPLDERVRVLERALVDVLDSQGAWYEIQEHTGLPEARCKEIAALVMGIRAAES